MIDLYCLLVIAFETYSAFETPLARVDMRVRIVLFLAYVVMLFLVETWVGLALAFIIFLRVFASARIDAKRVLLPSIPVYVLVGFMLLSSSLVFVSATQGAGLVQGELVELVGPLCFSPEGFNRGCFFAARIVLIVWVCLVLAFTANAVELTNAVRWFMSPLSKLGISVDDAAVMISIAIRFIPIMGEEFAHIRAAQWSRGGLNDEGSLIERVEAWIAVLMPLIVGLFRRAEALAVAMDARCYGASDSRTSLNARKFDQSSCMVLVAGLLVAVAAAALL